MKLFSAKTAAKLSILSLLSGTVAVTASSLMFFQPGYRTIAVADLSGVTTVENETRTVQAFLGQHLASGDELTVGAASDLTLTLDSDKAMYAKEYTHFWLEAAGSETDTRTHIRLDDGSVLIRIDDALTDSECFDVSTPNATMAVRGTVFRVYCYEIPNGDTYTAIDVLGGKVHTQVKTEDGEYTGEERLLLAGESALVRSNDDISEFVRFGSAESIDIPPQMHTADDDGDAAEYTAPAADDGDTAGYVAPAADDDDSGAGYIAPYGDDDDGAGYVAYDDDDDDE